MSSPGDLPRVSVTMPVFNGEAYVTEAVNSVLAQTFRDFELVAVNDGSTDSTPDILASLASQDKRIRVFHHQPNKGIVAARNKALEMARGKYIAVMDADDVCLPERLAAQVAFLDTHPEVGALGSGVQGIDGGGRVFRLSPFTSVFNRFHICYPVKTISWSQHGWQISESYIF